VIEMLVRVVSRRRNEFLDMFCNGRIPKEEWYSTDYRIVGFLAVNPIITCEQGDRIVEIYPKENDILGFMREYIQNLKKYSVKQYTKFISNLFAIINETL